MEIETVEIMHFKEDKSDVPNFIIHWKDTEVTSALLVTSIDNRHYHEIAEWYKNQKKKPFKFEF